MSKKIISVVVCFCLVGAIVGCGANNKEATKNKGTVEVLNNQENSDKKEKVNINIVREFSNDNGDIYDTYIYLPKDEGTEENIKKIMNQLIEDKGEKLTKITAYFFENEEEAYYTDIVPFAVGESYADDEKLLNNENTKTEISFSKPSSVDFTTEEMEIYKKVLLELKNKDEIIQRGISSLSTDNYEIEKDTLIEIVNKMINRYEDESGMFSSGHVITNDEVLANDNLVISEETRESIQNPKDMDAEGLTDEELERINNETNAEWGN